MLPRAERSATRRGYADGAAVGPSRDGNHTGYNRRDRTVAGTAGRTGADNHIDLRVMPFDARYGLSYQFEGRHVFLRTSLPCRQCRRHAG